EPAAAGDQHPPGGRAAHLLRGRGVLPGSGEVPGKPLARSPRDPRARTRPRPELRRGRARMALGESREREHRGGVERLAPKRRPRQGARADRLRHPARPHRSLSPVARDQADHELPPDRGPVHQPESRALAPRPPRALLGPYLRWLENKPITNSRLIEVQFTSPSPELSQRVANAHTRGYIVQNLESKFQLTAEARSFLESEIDRVQRELAVAEEQLNEFRRRHAVVSLDDRQNAIVERLTDLGHRLTEAQAARIAAEAEHRLVRESENDSLPSVLINPLIQALK